MQYAGNKKRIRRKFDICISYFVVAPFKNIFMSYNILRFTYSFISQLIDLGFEGSAAWCYPPTILLYFTRIRGAFRKSGGEAIGYNSLTINIIDTF